MQSFTNNYFWSFFQVEKWFGFVEPQTLSSICTWRLWVHLIIALHCCIFHSNFHLLSRLSLLFFLSQICIRNLTKTFYKAGLLLDVLQTFGELSEEVLLKQPVWWAQYLDWTYRIIFFPFAVLLSVDKKDFFSLFSTYPYCSKCLLDWFVKLDKNLAYCLITFICSSSSSLVNGAVPKSREGGLVCDSSSVCVCVYFAQFFDFHKRHNLMLELISEVL